MFENLFGHRLSRMGTVKGRKVEITFDFTKYPPRLFEAHNTIAKFRQGLLSNEQLSGKLRTAAAELNEAEILFNQAIADRMRADVKLVDYSEFKAVCADLVGRALFSLLNGELGAVIETRLGALEHLNNPKQRVHKQGDPDFMLNLRIMNSIKEETVTLYDGTTSLLTAVDLDISGALLLGRLYLPWKYLGRIQDADAAYLKASFAHELQHRLQDTRGVIKVEEQVKRRLATGLGQDPAAWKDGVSNVYQGVMNLCSEGMATFAEQRNTKGFLLDLDEINRLRGLLLRMASTSDPGEEARIFDEEFSPSSRTGEYYLGSIMCQIIGLSIHKRMGLFLSAQVKKPGAFKKKENVPFERLPAYLLEVRKITLCPLNADVYAETHKELSALKNYLAFIRRFQQACDELGFTGELRFFDLAFYNELKQRYYASHVTNQQTASLPQ